MNCYVIVKVQSFGVLIGKISAKKGFSIFVAYNYVAPKARRTLYSINLRNTERGYFLVRDSRKIPGFVGL